MVLARRLCGSAEREHGLDFSREENVETPLDLFLARVGGLDAHQDRVGVGRGEREPLVAQVGIDWPFELEECQEEKCEEIPKKKTEKGSF